MKTKFTLLALFVFLGSNIEAATASCTCSGGKRPNKTIDIGLGDDVKRVCETECKKMGLELVDAKKN
jgi:hypothetical protein